MKADKTRARFGQPIGGAAGLRDYRPRFSDYYDRRGRRISLRRWAVLHGRPGYKRITRTTLADGRWVSTVWLGLDHSWGDGPREIFETMVFASASRLADEAMDRYPTEREARRGHNRMVAWARAGGDGSPVA